MPRLPVLAFLAAVLFPGVAQAANYVFPGTLPSGCSGTGPSYTCGALALAWNDTLTINAPRPATITFNGNLNVSNAQINWSGNASDLNLIVNGALSGNTEPRIKANIQVTGNASIVYKTQLEGNLSVGGTLAFNSDSSITGNVNATGAVTLGYKTAITGTLTGASISDSNGTCTLNGAVTANTGAISLGYGTRVTGNVTAPAGAVTLGGSSKVTGNVNVGTTLDVQGGAEITGNATATGAATIAWASKVGGTTSVGSLTDAGASTFGGPITASTGSISLGGSSTVAGNVTALSGAVSLGHQTRVNGDVITDNDKITLGSSSNVTGCASTERNSANSIILNWAAQAGGVCCRSSSGCLPTTASCYNNGSGSTISTTACTAAQPPALLVDDDKAQCPTAAYTKIQDAVNAAANGETITICPGTYNENVNISGKALTLQSSTGNKADVTIRPSATAAIASNAALTVQNLTIASTTSGVNGVSACPSSATTLAMSGVAINVTGATGIFQNTSGSGCQGLALDLSNVDVTSNRDGIRLNNGAGAHKLDYMSITGNSNYYPLMIIGGSGATLTDVDVTGTGDYPYSQLALLQGMTGAVTIGTARKSRVAYTNTQGRSGGIHVLAAAGSTIPVNISNADIDVTECSVCTGSGGGWGNHTVNAANVSASARAKTGMSITNGAGNHVINNATLYGVNGRGWALRINGGADITLTDVDATQLGTSNANYPAAGLYAFTGNLTVNAPTRTGNRCADIDGNANAHPGACITNLDSAGGTTSTNTNAYGLYVCNAVGSTSQVNISGIYAQGSINGISFAGGSSCGRYTANIGNVTAAVTSAYFKPTTANPDTMNNHGWARPISIGNGTGTHQLTNVTAIGTYAINGISIGGGGATLTDVYATGLSAAVSLGGMTGPVTISNPIWAGANPYPATTPASFPIRGVSWPNGINGLGLDVTLGTANATTVTLQNTAIGGAGNGMWLNYNAYSYPNLNLVMSNVTVDAAKGDGVKLFYGTGQAHSLADVTVKATSTAMNLSRGTGATLSNLDLTCGSDGATAGNGLYLGYQTNLTLSGTNSITCKSPNSNGIYYDYANSGSTLGGAIIDMQGKAGSIGINESQNSTSVTITGNTIKNAPGYGIYINGYPATVTNNLVENSGDTYFGIKMARGAGIAYNNCVYSPSGHVISSQTSLCAGTSPCNSAYPLIDPKPSAAATKQGNFWGSWPKGTGFSDTCADANSDGLCDTASGADKAPLKACGIASSGLLVDDDRRQCPTAAYTNIQDAVNAAANGDTITICPGTYNERVDTKGLDNLILKSSTGNRADVTINASSGHGIYGNYSDSLTVKDLTVVASSRGIFLENGAGDYVLTNLAVTSQGSDGLYLNANRGGDNATLILSGSIDASTGDVGVEVYYLKTLTADGLTISADDNGIYADNMSGGAHSLTNLAITAGKDGVYFNASRGGDRATLTLSGSIDASSGDDGVEVYYINRLIGDGLTVKGRDDGIYADNMSGTGHSLRNVNITAAGDDALYFNASRGGDQSTLDLSGSTLNSSNDEGAELNYLNQLTADGLTISAGDNGIYASNMSGGAHSLTNLAITARGGDGIYFNANRGGGNATLTLSGSIDASTGDDGVEAYYLKTLTVDGTVVKGKDYGIYASNTYGSHSVHNSCIYVTAPNNKYVSSNRSVSYNDGDLTGNFWGSLSGSSGYSEICTDGNGDGVCDSPLTTTNMNGTDSYPMKTCGIGPLLPTPIADWRMDELSWNGTAGEVADSSGNVLHATAAGGASTTAGKLCQAANLNGTTGYVHLPDSSQLNIAANSGYTFTGWIKTTDGYGQVLSFRDQANGTPVIDLSIGYNGAGGNAGQFVPLVRHDNGGIAYFTSGPSVNDGQWHFLALIYNPATGKLVSWVDGTRNETSHASGANSGVTTSGQRDIGREGAWVAVNFTSVDREYLAGQIDELKYWSGALTDAQIAAIRANETAGKNWDGSARSCGATLSAHYRFDDTWSSSDMLDDSSGNARHATLSGTVAQEAAPAAGAKPNTCQAGNFNKTGWFTTASGLDIDTAADGKNSVSFWMYWDGGFSSSNFTMPFSWGGVYYDLAVSKYRGDMGNGVIGFNTGNGDVFGVTADGLANGWHHVAAVFNNGDVSQNKLYIDGVSKTLISYGSQYARSVTTSAGIGAGAAWGGDYRWSGKLDQMKIYKGEMSAVQIAADMAEATSCSGPDHYELSLPSAGIACASVTATVTACTDATRPCENKYAGVSGQTATLAAGAGTLSGTTVTFDATGVATATLSHPGAIDGAAVTVTLSGEQLPATNSRQCCPDGANCVARDNCTTTFSTAGLLISDSATGGAVTPTTQISGKTPGQFYLRAVKTNTATMACEAAVSGARSVNFRYACVDPASCTGSGNWMTVAGTSFGSAGGTPTLSFDAGTGAAPFTFRYDDAGKITLTAGPVTADNGAQLAATTTGAFVVKPAGLCVYSTDLSPCTAADATCAAVKKAGAAFNLTARGVKWESDADTDLCSANNATTPNYRATGISLASDLAAPSGGSAGSVGVASMNIAANGWASVNQTISEVGVFRFSASPPAYFGETIGSPPFMTGALGRFTPDHFDVTVAVDGALATACGSSFTYTGQPMGYATAPSLTIRAMNGLATPGLTTNYTGAFQKLTASGVTITAPTADAMQNGKDGATKTALSATLNTGTLTNTGGTLTYTLGSDSFTYTRDTNSLTGPYTVAVRLPVASVIDSDAVTKAASATWPTLAPSGVDLRYGRLRLLNFYGSELLPARVEYRAEYRDGSRWATNTPDTCSAVAAANVATGGLTVSATLPPTYENGIGFITFNAAAVAAYDIAINLNASGSDTSCNASHGGTTASRPWLQGEWAAPASCNGTAAWAQDPNARIKLGSPKANYIYLRERY